MRKRILHFRNGSGTQKPAANQLEYGEIAMTYTNLHEKLYTKSSTNAVVEFSADHLIHDRIDEQDERVSDAIGLSETTNTDDNHVNYVYVPTNDLLSECHTMNDSVEYLANKVKDCLALIETIKSNVYMIETGFVVQPNDTFTMENISFAITNNGNPTTPTSVNVTKYVNDAATGTTIINVEAQSSGSATSNIEGSKEKFVIDVVPNLPGALSTKVEINMYLSYVGTSSLTTLTTSVMESFDKAMSDGVKFEKDVHTNNGEYIWICVPSELRVLFVSDNGMQVTLDEHVQTISTSNGEYSCYRNYKMLVENTWHLVIKHQN